MSKNTERMAEVPWITRLEVSPGLCPSIKWGKVALKHLYRMGNRPPEGIPDKAKCKRKAWWHFEALDWNDPDLRSKTGDYCWSHLWQQIMDNDQELHRLQSYWNAKEKEENGSS